MRRGGARPGAGRRKGSRGKAQIELLARARGDGEQPLDHMLKIMRDESEDKHFRAQMAGMAAPFVHPRLAAIEHGGKKDAPLTIIVERFTGEADE